VKIEWADIFIVLFCTALMVLVMSFIFGCSSTCRKKVCCPEQGHGPCPICTNIIYDSGDIIYGRKR